MGDWYTATDCPHALFSYLKQKKIKLTFAFMWVEIQYIFKTLSRVLHFYSVLLYFCEEIFGHNIG